MNYLYSLFIWMLALGMRVASLWSYKMRRGLAGRRQSLSRVRAAFGPQDRVIWMHAASLGEYEQGLPVLEKLKIVYPHHKILVTFFSPSGYDAVAKRKTLADVICYLPLDTRQNVRAFTGSFHTDIFFTIKYDFWYHLLARLHDAGTRVFVVSALFYDTQIFFRTPGRWFIGQLQQHVDWIFHQTNQSTALAKNIGLLKSSTAGDTRYDRVKKIAAQQRSIEEIPPLAAGKMVCVVGSAWDAEIKITKKLSQHLTNTLLIIAPHDLKRTGQILEQIPVARRYTELAELGGVLPATARGNTVLVLDTIGQLSTAYRYADFALVGGGFHRAGLHNILEAAAYGIPVFFGNMYRKNPEADALIAAGAAAAFEDEAAAVAYLTALIGDTRTLKHMSAKARDFIAAQPDAATLIVQKMASIVG